MNAPVNNPSTPPAADTSSEEKKDSAITAFLKSLDPKVKPNASDKKSAGARFKEFQAKRKAALDAVKALEAEGQEVALQCLRAFGKVKLTVNGIDYMPTSRDERIYYKEMGSKGIEI